MVWPLVYDGHTASRHAPRRCPGVTRSLRMILDDHVRDVCARPPIKAGDFERMGSKSNPGQLISWHG